jgi:hypothetical protein
LSDSAEAHDSALRSVQRRLESFYALERAPDVVDFVRIGAAGSRETLLLQQTADDVLELALVLPPAPATAGAAESDVPADPAREPSDHWLQLVEGVSHFLYIVERARTGLPATQLELELQAEVDKFVILALDAPRPDADAARVLVGRLYDRVAFVHPVGSEAGDRYRLANGLAARFVLRLTALRERTAMARALRRFYRSGQTEKIRLARAA